MRLDRLAGFITSLGVLLVLLVLLNGCESGGKKEKSSVPLQSHVQLLPDQMKWEAGPASLPPGARIAVLEGDPAQSGFFTMRVWFPDGYRIGPHFHPGVERVTVVTGTFYLGQGDRFDESTAQALPVGSYTSMPAGMHRYAFAKGPAVVQISTLGPWGITYINPADDPRKTAK